MASTDIDRLSIDTIRTLSMDGVQAANSGHPGLPMAMAPVAYLLFARGLRHLSAAETATLTLAEPLTAALLRVVVLSERMSAPAAVRIGRTPTPALRRRRVSSRDL